MIFELELDTQNTLLTRVNGHRQIRQTDQKKDDMENTTNNTKYCDIYYIDIPRFFKRPNNSFLFGRRLLNVIYSKIYIRTFFLFTKLQCMISHYIENKSHEPIA